MDEMRLKPIPGYDDLYWVSNSGRIFSMKFNKCVELRQCDEHLRSGPRMTIQLCHGGKRRTHPVHFLVAQTFGLEKKEGDYLLRHLDGNYQKNWVSNLAWGTDQENREDRMGHEQSKSVVENTDWVGEIK